MSAASASVYQNRVRDNRPRSIAGFPLSVHKLAVPLAAFTIKMTATNLAIEKII